MTTLSDDQFRALLTRLTAGTQNVVQEDHHQPRNDPTALGPMPPFVMGSDKMTRLQQFDTWLEEAENRMSYIGITDEGAKKSLLRSWGGSDLVQFMKTHAKIIFESVPATDTEAAIVADTYKLTVVKIKAELQKLVNKTMAMHQLLTTKQGNRKWMDFIKDLEDKAHILNFNSKPYKQDDAVKDAAIFGMADPKLKEKALAEDPDLLTLIRWGQSRETGREGANDLKDNTSVVSRVESENMDIQDIDEMINSLQIMKIQKQGRYSGRPNRSSSRSPRNQCRNCSSGHPEGRCPARGRECFTCGGMNHFALSAACNKTKGSGTVNLISEPERLDTTQRLTYGDTTMDTHQWPGVASKTSHKLRLISSVNKVAPQGQATSKHVKVRIGGVPMTLFTDTGSDFTIIPPKSYKKQMGKVEAADTHLRAWGSKSNLDVKGMIKSTLATEKGATTNTKIFIVDGFHPEPLLGDQDAESLGYITFNKEGREPEANEAKEINRIAQKLRDSLHINVETAGKIAEDIPKSERKKVDQLIERFKGLVFSDDKIGKIKTKPIHLEYDPNFTPIQPAFHNVPIHYQPQVSAHLQFLREQGAITDVDPKKAYECVMNTVITDKKDDNIRMNLDTTPWNPGMKRTKFHVQTPQEIRHELKEAGVFSEVDMAWAFHQLGTDESTKERSIFQTHEGLHRMEVLYFGPTASSGIFHNEIRKILRGLRGVINIYDNILIWGRDFIEHLENLTACLERCLEYGIILKLSKTHTCMNKIKWFGRTFTTDGVTVDGDKIQTIIAGGKPENIEDIRSFLMACQYNAKFIFDNPDVKESYEEVTAPLRKQLKKEAKFTWGPEQEQSYDKLLTLMTSPATLRPYDPKLPTHFVADSSEVGIQASIYQEREPETWVPIDHISRALTSTEQNYSPIERESLAQSWGMDQFRFYLVGGEFTAWSDHQPLTGIYNQKQKATTKKMAKHRDQICDLQFTLKYLPGKDMPCDYGSRHPYPIDHLTEEDKEKLGCDTGKEIYVRKIDIGNSPDAISIPDIRRTASKDSTYQTIMKEITAGRNPSAKIPLEYKRTWEQLSVIDGLLHKGSKLVLPNGELYPGTDSIRQRAVHIAHEGHPGIAATKQHLRGRLWFPGMDKAVEDKVSSCIPCQASTEVKHRDPLVPSIPPETPWQKLAADHWGPTVDGKYLLVVVDELSRYPEVAIVNSTGADANIEAFDNIFTRHGYCESLKTDSGPPFNGNESHQLQQYFKWAGIKHHTITSAEDPEANGLAESFMKHCKKIWHTAIVERKNPKAEINKHLLMVRSTPHPTTKKTPAELLFGRSIRTRLPQTQHLTVNRPDIKEAIQEDIRSKQKQKQYKDDKSYVKHHKITKGNQVLFKQKSSKHVPPYDPRPYTVTDVRGHQITASREHQTKTRDAKKWKKIEVVEPTDYRSMRQQQAERELALHYEDDSMDIGTAAHQTTHRMGQQGQRAQQQGPIGSPPLRRDRSTRRRRRPVHLEDYEM